MTGDPNTHKLTPPEVAGVPSVKASQEWTIDDDGFDTANLDHLASRCEFWRKKADRVPM